jgi:site-specific recombinase XerD
MVKASVDGLILQSLVILTSLESLIKGYLLNWHMENKFPKTISGYEMVLRNFLWYIKANELLDIQKITANHIKYFLMYLTSESHRWNSSKLLYSIILVSIIRSD